MELKEKTLFEANKFFIAGEYKKGIKTLKDFLKIHNNDYDVSLALSIFYETTEKRSESFKRWKNYKEELKELIKIFESNKGA